MAFNQIARAGPDHSRTLPLLRQLVGTALHERSQTIPIQKHIARVQFRASADQRVSVYRGEWRRGIDEAKVVGSIDTNRFSYSLQGMNGGWLRHYSWRCQPVDTSRSEFGMRVS